MMLQKTIENENDSIRICCDSESNSWNFLTLEEISANVKEFYLYPKEAKELYKILKKVFKK